MSDANTIRNAIKRFDSAVETIINLEEDLQEACQILGSSLVSNTEKLRIVQVIDKKLDQIGISRKKRKDANGDERKPTDKVSKELAAKINLALKKKIFSVAEIAEAFKMRRSTIIAAARAMGYAIDGSGKNATIVTISEKRS